MESKAKNLLKLLGADKPTTLEEKQEHDLIADMLKEEPSKIFPRQDQILNSIETAQVLFDSCINLAFYAAKSFRIFIDKFGMDQEDFDQIVYQALWSAALTFNKDKCVKFSTWAFLISRQVAARDITRYYVRPGRIGQSITLYSKDGDIVELNDIVDYKELNVFDKVVAHEILENLYKHSGARETEILVERIVWDMTLDECGINRNLTRERIRQLETRGMQRLKAIYHSGNVKLLH